MLRQLDFGEDILKFAAGASRYGVPIAKSNIEIAGETGSGFARGFAPGLDYFFITK